MKTAASITSVKISITLEIVGKDDLRHPLNMGGSTKIIANAGEKYRIVKKHNANDVLADDVVVTKSGDNLEISYADDTHVTLEGFYSADAQLELPANDGGIHTVTSNSESLSTNESNYVYAHGNHDTLMSMTQNNQALQVAVADRISVSDLPHYAELATGVATGVATDAVIGSAAAGTTAATSTAAVAAGTAATTGLSTMAMVGIGAVGVGGGAVILNNNNGNGSSPASTDTTAPATAGFVFTDAGVSATDGLSSNGTITLALASDTATWQYSLDNGTTWVNGSGHTITLAEGTYDKQDVQVKQFDAAGNSSISHMSTTPTLAASAMVQLEALNTTAGYDRAPQITAVGTTGEYVVTFYGQDSAGDNSIFVQKFNADGTTAGAMVQLEALNTTTGYDSAPQITAVGTTGEYVVTFHGVDSTGDNSIFVQKFNADGTTAGAMVQLEALNNTTGHDTNPQITSVGTTGEYVVTFYGGDSAGDLSIFVQKFNADGTTAGAMVQLEALGNTTGSDQYPQITSVGTTGEYVVTFFGQDNTGDYSIFVQKCNADGTVQGTMVQLEALNTTTGRDTNPQITAVGTTGEYVVTFHGVDSTGDYSIFVQKFNADGTTAGAMVQLEALNTTAGYGYDPQITAVGTAGEYVVTFWGEDSMGYESIFVQKFNADGTVQGSMVQLEGLGNTTGYDYAPQITAVGTTGEYVVTFEGDDANGGWSIFVQKFDANGAVIGTMSQINVPNASYDENWGSQITAVGIAGEFIVTFTGMDSNGDNSIFVQKFNANGTIVDLSNTMMIDTTAPSLAITSASTTNSPTPTISGTVEIGSTVTLVVAGATYTTTTAIDGTWSVDTAGIPTSGTLTLNPNGDNSVSVTATDAAGNVSVAAATQTLHIDTVAPALIAPSAFVLSDTGISASDGITANGLITITLAGDTATWQYSLDAGVTWTNGVGTSFILPSGSYDKQNIVVKQIDAENNASVSRMVSMIHLEALNMTTGHDFAPQITSVGTTGEYIVTFYGRDSAGDDSIFVQKFNIDGTTAGTMVQLEALNNTAGYDSAPQITAVGTTGEYVVTFRGEDSMGYESIFVQKFNADGTTAGAMVQLEALNTTIGSDYAPQITAVGTTGEYVVTFYGNDGTDNSIFVQKFNADGTTAGTMIQLEALNMTTGHEYDPQITAVGTTGEYVVTFYGIDSTGDNSIFVQKFNTDGTTAGTMVQLEALNMTTGYDGAPQITAVGTTGEYVVTFFGQESTGDYSIFVQKFNADGTTAGNAMVQLEALNNTIGSDHHPQITSVGTNGEYVVTFQGNEGTDYSIFVQKFNADGTVQGAMVQLEALNMTTGYDAVPQITAVGTTGEYVVTFFGEESTGDHSIFVQKFNADGTTAGTMVQLEALGNTTGHDEAPQVTAVGTTGEYVVTFEGPDSTGDYSIFVQKFNADGTKAADTYNTVVVDTTVPTFSSSDIATTHDNITTSTVVYNAQTTENDTGMSYSISGLDRSLFNLNSTTGEVTFVTAPNVASPVDSGANNVYDFTITATDIAGNTVDQTVALGVTPDFAGTTVSNNGVSFTLGAESIQNGKSYYYVTNINNTGLAYTTHDVIDNAFNGGADTVDTTVTAGVDDARTFISAGVTYILPTATELLALSPITPTGWGNNGFFLSATQDTPDVHIDVLVTSDSTLSRADSSGDYMVLQVIPA